MTTKIHDLEINEISILTTGVEPAVKAARVAIIKRDDGAANEEADDLAKKAIQGFDRLVEGIRKCDDCGHIEALRKARGEHADAFEAYQAAGMQSARSVQKAVHEPSSEKRRREFMEIAERLRRDLGVKKHIALQKARVQYPDEYQAAYG